MSRDGHQRLYLIDLRRQAFAEMAEMPQLWHEEIAVSPDYRRLAYVDRNRRSEDSSAIGRTRFGHTSFIFGIVDLRTGRQETSLDGFNYAQPMTGGFSGPSPPMFWLDEQRLLFVRTVTPEAGEPSNMLTTVDVVSGELKEVATIPRSVGRFMTLKQPMIGSDMWVTVSSSPYVEYRIDVETGELTEQDLFAAVVGQAGERVELRNLAVSPDGQRVIWTGPRNNRSRSTIFYRDRKAGGTREVTTAWLGDARLWFKRSE
jgi:hypothetical protein